MCLHRPRRPLRPPWLATLGGRWAGDGSAGKGLVVNVSERKGFRPRKTPVVPNPLAMDTETLGLVAVAVGSVRTAPSSPTNSRQHRLGHGKREPRREQPQPTLSLLPSSSKRRSTLEPQLAQPLQAVKAHFPSLPGQSDHTHGGSAVGGVCWCRQGGKRRAGGQIRSSAHPTPHRGAHVLLPRGTPRGSLLPGAPRNSPHPGGSHPTVLLFLDSQL